MSMVGKSGQYGKLLDGKFCDFDWKNKEIHKGNMPYWREIWSNWREILICLQGNGNFVRPCKWGFCNIWGKKFGLVQLIHSQAKSRCRQLRKNILKIYKKKYFNNYCKLLLQQYGTVYKRPENRVHSRNSAIHKIIHCYLGPIVAHFLSTCDWLGFYTWIHHSLSVKFCT